MALATPKNKTAKSLAGSARRSLEKPLSWILLIGGILGSIAAFVISYDKEQLLKNASFQPNCDINPIISCGSVMKSEQGSVFGFPNPWVGLAAFAVLITIGVGIFAGARYKRWFWLGLQFGTILGLIFVHWLIIQSIFFIKALCPYCMLVWVVVITTFWYTLLYNLEQGHIRLSAKLQPAGDFLRRHHLDVLFFWFFVIFAVIMWRFWYFFGRPFGA